MKYTVYMLLTDQEKDIKKIWNITYAKHNLFLPLQSVYRFLFTFRRSDLSTQA